jgi:hypothetical protein
MSRRRHRSQTSSLDLFLDTICNAFGGIMFISILISILIQMRGGSSDAPIITDGISEYVALEKQSKVAELQQKIRILSEMVSDRERLMFNEDSTESAELLAQKEQLTEVLSKSQQTQQSMLDLTSSTEIEMQQVQMELQELTQRLNDARVAVSERSEELEQALTAAETTMQVPKVSSTLKGNLMLAMRYGKVFLITDIEGNGAHGINTQHATAVNLVVGVQVRLKQNAGWDLSSDRDRAKLESVLQSRSNARTFISVVVFADSHAFFPEFKKKLVDMQYDYDLLPLDNPDTLMIVKGNTATVQ